MLDNNPSPETLEKYVCPITQCYMQDPYVTIYGHSFEGLAIQQWVSENGTCPLTRQPLTLQDLNPNVALKAEMEFLNKGVKVIGAVIVGLPNTAITATRYTNYSTNSPSIGTFLAFGLNFLASAAQAYEEMNKVDIFNEEDQEKMQIGSHFSGSK